MANQTSTVASKLQKFLKIERGTSDTDHIFAAKLADAANALSNDAWESLGSTKIGSKSQKWVNRFLEARDRGEKLPLPPGLARANGSDPDERTEEDDDEVSEGEVLRVDAPSGPIEDNVERGRGVRTSPDAKIKILRDKNPYRTGTKAAGFFDKYREGMTFKQALDAGVPRIYLLWDRRHGHITF